jgi:hypothetical protein
MLIRLGLQLPLEQGGQAQTAGPGQVLAQVEIEEPAQYVATVFAKQTIGLERLPHLLDELRQEQGLELLAKGRQSGFVALPHSPGQAFQVRLHGHHRPERGCSQCLHA